MSDVSALSHEYQTASDLARRLNESVIALKKARIGPEQTAQTAPDSQEARNWLAGVTDGLVALLAPGDASSPQANQAALRVPGALVARLRTDHQGDIEYFLADLRCLAAHLRDGSAYLTEADIELLDRLAGLVDAETSSAFRRLMRK
jgi:hypothetical protein